MSYNIVRGIRFDKETKEVWFKAACNNVSPKNYDWWQSSYYSELWREQGLDTVELEIFKTYENGCRKAGSKNRFTRALEVLRHMPEYDNFNWRNEPHDEISGRRITPELDALLKKALKTMLPSDKFVVKKKHGDVSVYLHKLTKYYAKWCHELKQAKVFRYEQDALNILTSFTGSAEYRVTQLRTLKRNRSAA